MKDDDKEDHYHNYCQTDLQFPLIPGLSVVDGRPVAYCGCCDETEVGGLDKIKRSKKGEHCAYDAVVRRGLEAGSEVAGASMRGTSKVSRARGRNVE